MIKVKYYDNTGSGDSVAEYASKEEARAAIDEELEIVKEYFEGRDYDYADFGNKVEIWACGDDEYASWEIIEA